jgi:flagellar motor protein MotB
MSEFLQNAIGRQSSSYRQGLILGLTMAETMLLLVFCLLIATAVSLAHQRVTLEDMVRQADRMKAALQDSERRIEKEKETASANERLVEALKKNTQIADLVIASAGSTEKVKIDEFWRRLTESEGIIEKLERNGLPRESLENSAEGLARAYKLQKQGVDLNAAVEKAARMDKLNRTIADRTGGPKGFDEVLRLVERGHQANREANPEGDRSGHTWPPIINLSEAGGYYFAVGSAELAPLFDQQLRTVVIERLLHIARDYDVDVIEVVGHTDEQPIGARPSNLDRDLMTVLNGGAAIAALRPADNAGLGLARALAVVTTLRQDPRLADFRILPLSGAQLIQTDERLTRGEARGDVKERRRIEIRLRKSA